MDEKPGGSWWDKVKEWVHGALDIAGLVPGLGEIADGANALIYLAEGRFIEAGISAVAMIPILGDVGKVGKWGVKAGKELLEEGAERLVKEGAETLVGASSSLKAFNKNNFRENLRRLTRKSSDDIVGLEAHHILPQEFLSNFKKMGFNIHDPRLGSWVNSKAHRIWSYEYNVKWRRFLQQERSAEQIMEFVQHMTKEYGLDVYFYIS